MKDEILETKPLSRHGRDARFSSLAETQRKSAHVPVLLKEVLEYLAPRAGEFMIDGTADGGGHAAAILEKLTTKGKLLAIDWDAEILDKCRARLGRSENVLLANANYVDTLLILKKKKLPKADGLLLDLGFSSYQMDSSGRGFSFREANGTEPLLMTYSDKEKPVKEILREISEEELSRIIRELGGERFAGRVARVIKTYLKKQSIETSGELAGLIQQALPKHYERGRIDPATRTFQALRIYANHELENLKAILHELPEIMASHGRVTIISFHSLEDRIIKQAFRDLEKGGQFKILTKKPITPTRQEILENIRSRSAKLRVIQRI
jgi:16S rRNA (cytosine1402-N4)-methyltransferase